MSALRLIALSLAATLGGCALTPPPAIGPMEPRTPTELWSAPVTAQPEEMRLAIHPAGLSTTQADALATFADDWRASGRGPITLRSPVGGPDAGIVARAGEGARAFLVGQGIPAADVRLVGYEANGDAAAPLIVGRERYAVTLPVCGTEWTNISKSADNRVQPNFGCAVTANMAAQIANPADLLGPSPTTSTDAARRDVVLGKYRRGEVTSSARDGQAAGAVSQVVQ